MTTKSWTKLSTMLSDVLSETLDNSSVDKIMNSWNSKKGDVTKLINNTGRTKRTKDPNAPKKWNTSYIIFCGEQRDKIKKSNPNMSATEITTKLGELWKALPEKDKKKFEEASKKDKARYEKEMESYTPPPESESEEKGKRGRGKKERTGPKRPLTAYMYFCQDKRNEIKTANPEMTGTTITAHLGSLWKDLSDEKKAPYEEMQAKDKARYDSEKSGASATADSSKPVKKESKKEKKEEPKKEESKKEVKKEKKEEPKKEDSKKDSKKKEEPKKEETKKDSKKKEEKDTGSKGKKTDEVKKTPGYEYFLREQTEELESENPDWGSRKIQAEVAKRWKELSHDDRDAYENEANADEDGSEVELEDE